ncbi:MAG: methionine--tRNA ligase [Thermoplasmata archaeon]|nr:methionine--tRNA ligase [Thermoplasmata archaeon]
MARIFIGLGWPYANGPFHIGHLAGAYLPGDIFARFHRLLGDEVLMVSGSDMHGTPTTYAAEKEGVHPQVIAERYHEINKTSFERLGVSFDLFTHTHTTIHERTTQELFLRQLQNGFIDRRSEENPYCPKDRRFLPDRYLVGRCPFCGNESARGDECDRCGRILEPKQLLEPRCVVCGTGAEFRPTEHFYLRLDKMQETLGHYLKDKDYWRGNVLAATRNFLEGGLKPRPITRDLTWGVPIPLDGYPSKRIYVWFEAVIGYLSASKEWAVRKGEPEAWHRFWDPEAPVRQYYFVGKDNIFFHTLLWPGILIAVGGLQRPFDVPANEWLQIEGRKISKSRPSDVDAYVPSLLAHYAPDVIRFYAAALAPQNHDTELDWDEFARLPEEVLSNQYGNLVQRVLVFAREQYGGKIPAPPADWDRAAPEGVGARIRRAHAEITGHYEAVRLKEAFERALTEVREGNRWFQEARPWQASEADRARTVHEGLWLLKAAATWLSPVLPFSSEQVWRMLGFAQGPGPGEWAAALDPPPAGQSIGKVQVLFPRAGAPTNTSPPPTVEASGASSTDASFVPFAIRAARVRTVAPHPSADKLYVLELDLGEAKPRTVVAGLRPFYREEELRDRRVALLSNLEPRTIRKMTSQGMVLAADTGSRVEVLSLPEAVPLGAYVTTGPPGSPAISYSVFESNPLLVGTVTSVRDGQLTIDIGDRTVAVEGSWPTGSRVVVQLDGPGGSRGRIIHFASGDLLVPGGDLPAGTRVR